MSEPLTPAQIINQVAPSTLSILNSTLITSMGDSSSSIHDPMNYGMDNYHITALRRPKERNYAALPQLKKEALLRSALSRPLIVKKLRTGYLNWNGYCEQDDDMVKNTGTSALHHTNKNNATAHHTGESGFVQKKTGNFNKMMRMCVVAIMSKMMENI